jgi:hypothetical protein
MDVVLFANIYRCGMDIVRFEIGRCENLNVCPVLPVSLDCPFLTAPPLSVDYNVYSLPFKLKFQDLSKIK